MLVTKLPYEIIYHGDSLIFLWYDENRFCAIPSSKVKVKRVYSSENTFKLILKRQYNKNEVVYSKFVIQISVLQILR